jgi:hypothetical protein
VVFSPANTLNERFSYEWHYLINSFMSRDSVAIKVNDDGGKYLQTLKGLRQGDPLPQMHLI